MHIEWKSNVGSPYLSKQIAEWPGIRISRAQVMPGRMLEHSNNFHEVNVAIAGALTTEKIGASGNRVKTACGKGNLCITPAGQPVSARWDKPLDNLMMSLDAKFVSGVAAGNGFLPNVEFVEVYKKKDPLVPTIGMSLLESAAGEHPQGKLYSDSLIQTLTLHLLTNYTTAASVPAKHNGGLSGHNLRRVTEFIDSSLADDVSLGEIAAIAGLSPYHFSRAFRRSTGTSPQQYVTQRRVDLAKELLARPELPIVEISLRTGFKNQSHFTTLFRKYTNFNPQRSGAT